MTTVTINHTGIKVVTVGIQGLPGTGTGTVTSSQITDLQETVEDLIGSSVVAGTNVTVSYNDATGKTTINSSASGGGGGLPSTYVMVAGVIRNTGAGWDLITDSGHTSLNIDSVTSGSTIVINYASVSASKVISFIAVPDETLAAAGFIMGSSVTVGAATLTLKQVKTIGDIIAYNGTAFAGTSGGPFTIGSYSSGVLTLTHERMEAVGGTNVSVTGRGGEVYPVLSTNASFANNSQTLIEFWDSATNTKLTTANTNMRAVVTRSAMGIANAANVNTTNYPLSNIWFMGIFENV